MAEFVRSLVANMRRFVGNRRREARFKVRLPFSVSLAGSRLRVEGSHRPAHLDGFTRDLSATGLALIVPSILLGEHHLTGEGRALVIKLELPTGPVEMQAVPSRYERLDEAESDKGYLIGARITKISDEARASFDGYLESLKKG